MLPWLFGYGCGAECHPDLEFSTYPLENLALGLLEFSLWTPIIAGGSGPFAHLPPLGLSAPTSSSITPIRNTELRREEMEKKILITLTIFFAHHLRFPALLICGSLLG